MRRITILFSIILCICFLVSCYDVTTSKSHTEEEVPEKLVYVNGVGMRYGVSS